MKKSVVIGVDFSKKTLDATCLAVCDLNKVYYKQFSNTVIGCIELIKWGKQYFEDTSEWLVCGEYTGLYSMTASVVFSDNNIAFWLENPSQIKLSSGLTREKNDKIDSEMIALYAARFMDKARLYSPEAEVLLKLRELVRFRDRLTKVKSQLMTPANELKQVHSTWQEVDHIQRSSTDIASEIGKQIDILEKKMLDLMKEDPELKRLYNLVNSIIGVGMQTAIYLLIHTSGFKGFASPRELACYCGIVPFAQRSGTSLNGKGRISNMANKKLKTLLHMCALNAVKYDPCLKAYYERKIGEGKHKMNVMNNVRNKLIHRIWAVVKSGQEYDKYYYLGNTEIAA
jgi:transposase